jgi:hypothetical protein
MSEPRNLYKLWYIVTNPETGKKAYIHYNEYKDAYDDCAMDSYRVILNNDIDKAHYSDGITECLDNCLDSGYSQVSRPIGNDYIQVKTTMNRFKEYYHNGEKWLCNGLIYYLIDGDMQFVTAPVIDRTFSLWDKIPE